jgi:DNA-directed RNA polymerase specialized sigma subunit
VTKEELKQYRSLGKEIDLLEEEIQRIRASLFSAPKLDGMPKSNYAADRTAETIAKVVDLETKLRDKIDSYISLRTQIEITIESLSSNERLLMRCRYIEGMSFEEIAVAMHYTFRHVTRMHGWALQKMS